MNPSVHTIDIELMSGAGNLFSVVDLRHSKLGNAPDAEVVKALCAPTEWTPRGSEGLLLIAPAAHSDRDFDVHFFNPDGSSSMMCGNGARCAVRFAQDHGFFESEKALQRFLMASSEYQSKIVGDLIEIEFPAPRNTLQHLGLDLDGCVVSCDYLDVGSDHVILSETLFHATASQLQVTDEKVLAARLRHHPALSRGANVNIYAPRIDEHITSQRPHYDIRTYERGVEDFSGACGTGALATAVSLYEASEQQVTRYGFIPPSAQYLEVDLHVTQQGTIVSMTLRGPATRLGTLQRSVSIHS